MKLKKSVASIGKFLLWTGVAAAATAAINSLTGWGIPDLAIPFVAAGLKGLATYAATEAAE